MWLIHFRRIWNVIQHAEWILFMDIMSMWFDLHDHSVRYQIS